MPAGNNYINYNSFEKVNQIMFIIAEKVTFLSSKKDSKEAKKEKEEN